MGLEPHGPGKLTTGNRQLATERTMPGSLIGKKLGMTGSSIRRPGDFGHGHRSRPVLRGAEEDRRQGGLRGPAGGLRTALPGQVQQAGEGPFRKARRKGGFKYLQEIRLEGENAFEEGQEITVEQFAIGDIVDVIGTSKGRGFAGCIKRHKFHRGPMTHGSMNKRPPGSIGCSAYPSRVVPARSCRATWATPG